MKNVRRKNKELLCCCCKYYLYVESEKDKDGTMRNGMVHSEQFAVVSLQTKRQIDANSVTTLGDF